MPLTFVVFANDRPESTPCGRYAHTLAEALRGQVLLIRSHEETADEPFLLQEFSMPEELQGQPDTTTELVRMAETLRSPTATDVAVPRLSAEAIQRLTARYHPLLFVLGQNYQTYSNGTGVATTCAKLLQTSRYPVLVVPLTAAASQVPRRILIAADREAFSLSDNSLPLRQLLALPGTETLVVHVASVLEDGRGCGLALQAVQNSGLVAGLPTPEARNFAYGSYAEGLMAAVHDTHADLIVVLARQRSYFGALFHRSVTARLLERCLVPVLVLPTD